MMTLLMKADLLCLFNWEGWWPLYSWYYSVVANQCQYSDYIIQCNQCIIVYCVKPVVYQVASIIIFLSSCVSIDIVYSLCPIWNIGSSILNGCVLWPWRILSWLAYPCGQPGAGYATGVQRLAVATVANATAGWLAGQPGSAASWLQLFWRGWLQPGNWLPAVFASIVHLAPCLFYWRENTSAGRWDRVFHYPFGNIDIVVKQWWKLFCNLFIILVR